MPWVVSCRYLPSTLWWRTAACKAGNSNMSEKGTCRRMLIIHVSQPWRVSSNLCRYHGSRRGAGNQDYFLSQKNRLNSCWSSRQKNRRAKRRFFIPDEGLQMQSHISWRMCLACSRKKGRSHAGVLRLPPVSTASKSSRTSPSISLRLVGYVKYWTASQPAVLSPAASSPFPPSSPNGGVLLAQGVYPHQLGENVFQFERKIESSKAISRNFTQCWLWIVWSVGDGGTSTHW